MQAEQTGLPDNQFCAGRQETPLPVTAEQTAGTKSPRKGLLTKDQATPKLLWSAGEAAEALGICEKTLWNRSQPQGSIPVVRIGRRCLYDPRDLQVWINEQKQDNSPKRQGNVSTLPSIASKLPM